MTNEEIQAELKKTRRSLLEMRMGLAQTQLKKVSDIKVNRKYVAQMMTILSERRKEEKMKTAA